MLTVKSKYLQGFKMVLYYTSRHFGSHEPKQRSHSSRGGNTFKEWFNRVFVMQYTIIINQIACIDLGLNFNQASVLNVLQNLNSWASKIIHEENEFYLITDTKLHEELPILGSSSTSYRKWVDQLVEKGLVEKITHKKMRYVRTTKKASLLFSDAYHVPASTQSIETSRASQHAITDNRVPASTQYDDYRVPASTTISIPINQDTNNKGTNSKQTKKGLVGENELEQELIDYRKEIKSPLKTKRGLTALVNAINKTAKAWSVHPDLVKNHMMEKEWQSVSPNFSSPFSSQQKQNSNCLSLNSSKSLAVKPKVSYFENQETEEAKATSENLEAIKGLSELFDF